MQEEFSAISPNSTASLIKILAKEREGFALNFEKDYICEKMKRHENTERKTI